MGKSIKEIAEIVANWWADAIQDPKFDNGPPSEGIVCIVGPVIAKAGVREISQEAIKRFAERLTDEIVFKLTAMEHEKPDRYGRTITILTLRTDYGPEGYLRMAAEATGIPFGNFPWKTKMEISRNHVSVRYVASWEILYANKEYFAGRIETYKEEIKRIESGEYDWLSDCERKDSIDQLKKDIAEGEKDMEEAEE